LSDLWLRLADLQILPHSLSLMAAVGLALAAQLHCAVMCGPLVMALQQPTSGRGNAGDGISRSGKSRVRAIFVGRIVSYALTGALAASLGQGLRPHPLGAKLLLLAASLFLLVASLRWIQDAGLWPRALSRRRLPEVPQNRPPNLLQSVANCMTQTLAGLHRQVVQSGLGKFGRWQAWVIGLAYPLMPCGQLWAVMGVSALSAHPLRGMLIAGGFAVMTTPTLWGATWIQTQMRSWLSAGPQLLRAGLVTLMLSLSLWSGWRFFDLSRHSLPSSPTLDAGHSQSASTLESPSNKSGTAILRPEAHEASAAEAPRCH